MIEVIIIPCTALKRVWQVTISLCVFYYIYYYCTVINYKITGLPCYYPLCHPRTLMIPSFQFGSPSHTLFPFYNHQVSHLNIFPCCQSCCWQYFHFVAWVNIRSTMSLPHQWINCGLHFVITSMLWSTFPSTVCCLPYNNQFSFSLQFCCS